MRIGLELAEPYFRHAAFKAGITTVEPLKGSPRGSVAAARRREAY